MPGRAHLCAVSPAGQACTVPDAEAQVLPTVHKSGPVHQHLRPCTVTRACAPLLWPVHSRVGEVHRHVRLCSRSVGLYATDRTPRVRRSGTGPSGGAQVPVSVHTPGPVHRHVGLCTATLVCAPPPWPVQSRVGLCRVTSACAPSRQLVQPSVGFCTFGSCAECRGPAQVRVVVHSSRRRCTRPALCSVVSACSPPPWLVHRHLGLCAVASAMCTVTTACAAVGRLVHDRVVGRVHRSCTGPRGDAQHPVSVQHVRACAPSRRLVHPQLTLCSATAACGTAGWVVCRRMGCAAAGGLPGDG